MKSNKDGTGTGDQSASFLHFLLFSHKNVQNFYSVSTRPRKANIRNLWRKFFTSVITIKNRIGISIKVRQIGYRYESSKIGTSSIFELNNSIIFDIFSKINHSQLLSSLLYMLTFHSIRLPKNFKRLRLVKHHWYFRDTPTFFSVYGVSLFLLESRPKIIWTNQAIPTFQNSS